MVRWHSISDRGTVLLAVPVVVAVVAGGRVRVAVVVVVAGGRRRGRDGAGGQSYPACH